MFSTYSVADNQVGQGTTFNGRSTYSGKVVFKDDFTNKLNFESNWHHTIKIADSPDYEFCVYTSDPSVSYIRDGNLVIKPTILPENFITSGRLEFGDECTGNPGTRECELQARSYMILPPVKSARLNTLGSFTFRYGIVEIIAKLPHGDWLVPELWLEPKDHIYGPDYKSGRIRLAMARGNENLKMNSEDLSCRKLEYGILMGSGDTIKTKAGTTNEPAGWHSDFHNFTLVWTRGQLSFYIDGENKYSVVEFQGTKLNEYLDFDLDVRNTWTSGTNIAPFDTEFYISLGVSAGGYRDFPDDSVSAGRRKPWKNYELKALLNFWQARGNWFSTWNGDDVALKVQRVKVTAV